LSRSKTAFEFSRNKLRASILALALVLTATIPHAIRCQADETAKHNVLHKVAQEWMQVGREQYDRSLFEAARQSFRRAARYRKYLTAAEQKELGKLSEKAGNAAPAKEPTSTSGQTTDRPLRPARQTKVKSLWDRLPPTAAKPAPSLAARKLKDAEIAVTVRSFYTDRVFVGGQVRKPGVVRIPGEITAIEAIMEIGGFDLRAAERKNVIVIRYTDGRRHAYKLDLAGNETKPFYLQPRDIVHVPRTKIAELNQWIDRHINKIIPDTRLSLTKTSGDTTAGVGSHR